MGFFKRLSDGPRSDSTPGHLPLAMPTRLALDLPNFANSLILYVIDPRLILDSGLKRVKLLASAILESESEDLLPAVDEPHAYDELRAELADLPLLDGAAHVVSGEFDHRWREVGARAHAAELTYGLEVVPGRINSVTSAALVAATLGLPVAEGAVAQYIVRNGYLASRILRGGPGAAQLSLDSAILDPGLFMLGGRSDEAWDLVKGLVGRSPLPSYARDAWETTFLGSRSKIAEFAEAVRDFNLAMWKFAQAMT